MSEEDIKIMKMVTGEEFIASLTKVGEEYVLSDPRALGVNEKGMLVLVPYMPYTDFEKEARIHERFVILVVNPVPDVANAYQESTGRITTLSNKIELVGSPVPSLKGKR